MKIIDKFGKLEVVGDGVSSEDKREKEEIIN